MNLKKILLTAAFGLIMSAVSAQSADIPITALPYTISSPGTYVLTGDLISPPLPRDQSAILVTGSAGTVVLDLKGFALTTPISTPETFLTGINVLRSNVTVRNGTIRNFSFGMAVGENTNPPQTVSNVRVENVTFSNLDETHIKFFRG